MIGYNSVWIEDECTKGGYGHEGIYQAYLRIAGVMFSNNDGTLLRDDGDTFWYLMTTGYVVCHSYIGYSIWQKQ